MQPPLIDPCADSGPGRSASGVPDLQATDVELALYLGNRFFSRQAQDAAGNDLPPEKITYTLSAGDLLDAFRQIAAAGPDAAPACSVTPDVPTSTEEDPADGPTLADTLTRLFRESGAVNYVEIGVDTNDAQMGDLLLTLQRRKGKTPHQLRLEAEVKLAETVIAAAGAPTRDEVMTGLMAEFESGFASMASDMTTSRGVSGDVDYVEMQIAVPDPEIGRLAVCIRRMGAKSPHALYLEAKSALAEARANRETVPHYVHSDDLAVDRFAAALKAKLAKARGKGRSDWDNPRRCSIEWLQVLLVQHLQKGDLVDVANFCMMLHQRGAPRLQIHASIDETPLYAARRP